MEKRILIDPNEFESKLHLRIAQGRDILNAFIKADSEEAYLSLERAYRRWDRFNHNWLAHIFNDESAGSDAGKYASCNAERIKAIASSAMHRTDSQIIKLRYLGDFILPKIEYLEDLSDEVDFLFYIPIFQPAAPPPRAPTAAVPLIHLHLTIQQVSGTLFASAHYPQAILAACTALDKAVQARAQLPASTVGTALMTTAFSAKAPLIHLSQDTNEQMGFMNLYQGSVQAIRNHYAHNLTEIPAPRALEWLSFISALFYKLDEAQPTVAPATP